MTTYYLGGTWMAAKRSARMTKTTARGKRKSEEGKITLYDLAEEITDLNREDEGFDSERKKVAQMFKNLGKGDKDKVIDAFNSDNDEDKKYFMNFLKALYHDEIEDGKVGRLILDNLSKNKLVNQKYSTQFYSKGLEYLRHTVKEQDKENFDILSKNFLSEKYYKEVRILAERLYNTIDSDLEQLQTILREDVKLELMAEYEEIINKSLENWRKEVVGIRAFEMSISSNDRNRLASDEDPGYREWVRGILEECKKQ